MFQDLVLRYAATWGLVLARLSGFVVASPFPGSFVSTSQRLTLLVTLAWIATSFAPPDQGRALDLHLALAACFELGCGLLVGLAFRFVVSAADILGQTLSHAVGLSAASVLNPMAGQEDTVLTRIVTLVSMLLALTAGVHRVAISALLESFRALPVGSPMSFEQSSPTMVNLAIESFAIGVRLAMPVLAVSLVVQLGLAMIARAAPALQIFSIGFGVLLATGCVVIMSSLRDIGAGLGLHFSSLGPWLDVLLTEMRALR